MDRTGQIAVIFVSQRTDSDPAGYAGAVGGRLLMALEEDGTWTCSAEGIPERMLPTDCR